MATRVGIELSPMACRIVEIDAPSWRARSDTRVRSYAVLPIGSPELPEKLAAYRRHDAAVVVWGMRGVHHQLFVPERGYDHMRADAIALAREGGAPTDGMLADIAPSGASQKGTRPVLLAMAASDDVSLAVQPLVDAGIRLRTVTTPAGALASLARLRRDNAVPPSSDEIEVCIALDERATAVALLRGGALVASRELSSGYLEDRGGAALKERTSIAARLIDEIVGLLRTIGAAPPMVRQVTICGGAPDLRSMAAWITERLDVEVEPLDSLFAIDSAKLPEPADEFREHSAELRLAWAAAADAAAPINLMRSRQQKAAKTRIARAAVVAGIGVGLGGGWLIARGGWVQSTARRSHALPSPVARVAPPPDSPLASSGALPSAPSVPPTSAAPVRPLPPSVESPSKPVGPSTMLAPQTSALPPAPSTSTSPRVAPPGLAPPGLAPIAPSPVAPPPPAARPAVSSVSPPRPLPQPGSVPVSPVGTPAAPPAAAVRRAAPTTSSSGPAPVRSPGIVHPLPAQPVPAQAPATGPAKRALPARPLPFQPVPARPLARPEPDATAIVRPMPAIPAAAGPGSAGSASASHALANRASEARTLETQKSQAPESKTPARQASVPPPSARITAPAPPAALRAVAPQTAEPRPAHGHERPPAAASPFDAVLGTILYAPDRKLAIIDGRIVGIGEEIKGARIVDITPSMVTLRDAQGRLRTLTLAFASP